MFARGSFSTERRVPRACFIILLGIVSLFADDIQRARRIAGPYLALLGVSATIFGIVSGFGELIGYAIRLVSWKTTP